MADNETTDERTEDGESSDGGETQQVTAPGEWERKPADPEDLRHDDGTEPLAPPSDESDDDLAEHEAGDDGAGGGDEGFDRPDPPDEAGVEDTAAVLETHGEPLLEGAEIRTPIGGLPTRFLLAMAAFVVVFCIAFFAFWGLLGNLGILLGILAGTALGLGAVKLLADRAE